jgi:hypothetical protein
MSGPVFSPQWTTPPPPKGADGRPVRGWRVTIGVVLAIVGHLFTFGGGALVSPAVGWAAPVLVTGGLVFAGCVGGGIALIVVGDRGLGIGLIAGWVGTISVLLVVGYFFLLQGFGG